MTKISIIIPVYNVRDYIERCLESILQQGFRDYELLINDDGSSDGTSEICDRYAQKDARIQVFHQTNSGVSTARNRMIEKAHGQYTLFFDGDDYLEENALQLLWDTAQKSDADSILFGYRFVPISGMVETHLPKFEKAIYEKQEIFHSVIPRFIGVSYMDIDAWLHGKQDALKKENTALWRSMIRSSVIKDNNLRFIPELKVGEDTCFTVEYLSFCNRIVVLNKALYNLVERETSAIYTYEKNSLAVLEGKTRLLKARRLLTEKIFERTRVDIEPYWYGTVVMSIVQLSFLLSESSNASGFQSLMKYINQPETKRAIEKMPHYRGGIKAIPFLLIRRRMFHLLFLSTWTLNRIGYKFER